MKINTIFYIHFKHSFFFISINLNKLSAYLKKKNEKKFLLKSIHFFCKLKSIFESFIYKLYKKKVK